MNLRKLLRGGEPIFKLKMTCVNGHSQEIRYKGGFTREWVDSYAGLMDGTSPMYVHSPIGTDSLIGKCGLCKGQLKSEVIEE